MIHKSLGMVEIVLSITTRTPISMKINVVARHLSKASKS